MDITYCMTKDCPLKRECLRHEDNHDMRGQIYSISDFGFTYVLQRTCSDRYRRFHGQMCLGILHTLSVLLPFCILKALKILAIKKIYVLNLV